jgi:hypothetical protein
MTEIAQAVQPKLFITTGTGGGIGSNVMLGDVIIAGTVRFDCRTQFKNEPWCNASFSPSKLPPEHLRRLHRRLLSPMLLVSPMREACQRCGAPRAMPSLPPISSRSTTPRTTTSCRAYGRHATWVMRWSPAHCRGFLISPGTLCAMRRIHRLRIQQQHQDSRRHGGPDLCEIRRPDDGCQCHRHPGDHSCGYEVTSIGRSRFPRLR